MPGASTKTFIPGEVSDNAKDIKDIASYESYNPFCDLNQSDLIMAGTSSF